MEVTEWIKKISEATLAVVDNLEKICEMQARCRELYKKSPLESDDISELRDLMEKIQMTINTLTNVFMPRLSEGYRIVYPGFISLRDALITRIHDADSRGIHPNINVTHYDEENLISEVTQRCENSIFGHVIGSMHMDQIIDVDQYSNVALVKRLEREDGLYQDIMERSLNSIGKAKLELLSLDKRIYDIFEFLNSAESSCVYDAERTPVVTERISINTGCSLTQGKREIKFAFTILAEIYHNLTIYRKAVDSYTSVVMESAFGDQYDFELM